MATFKPPDFVRYNRRKRSWTSFTSDSYVPSYLPRESINPLSHAPDTLHQFAVAGLAETYPVPSELIKDFPHRPLPPGDDNTAPGTAAGQDPLGQLEADDDDDNHDDGEDGADVTGRQKAKGKPTSETVKRERRLQERQVGALTAIIQRCVAGGDITRAKRAFGLLLRTRVMGLPVDLRKHSWWALGAEILMREGETPAQTGDQRPVRAASTDVSMEGGQDGEAVANHREGHEGGGGEDELQPPLRWGSAANIGRVRTYFEDLIQQYPYNRSFPHSFSALDLWPALLGCEVYNVHAEQRVTLHNLEIEAESWTDNENADERGYYDPGDDEGEGDAPQDWKEGRLVEERNRIRLGALAEMRGIAARMDALMDNAPYSTSLELLRLRGMVALYMGDLAVAMKVEGDVQDNEGRSRRNAERKRARLMFRKLLDHGGTLEPWAEHFTEEEDQEDPATRRSSMFTSLPIRAS